MIKFTGKEAPGTLIGIVQENLELTREDARIAVAIVLEWAGSYVTLQQGDPYSGIDLSQMANNLAGDDMKRMDM